MVADRRLRSFLFSAALCFAGCGSYGAGPLSTPDGGARSAADAGIARDGGAGPPADAGTSSAADAGSIAAAPDGGSVAPRGDGGTATLMMCSGVSFVEPCATCMRTMCGSQTASCFGANWATRDFSGGKCESHFSCVCPCGNDGACLARCPDPNGDCISCLAAAQQCKLANCVLTCGF